MLASRLVIAVALVLGAACTAEPAPTPLPTGTPAPSPTASNAPPPTGSALPPPPSIIPPPSVGPSTGPGLTWTMLPLPVDASYTTAGAIDIAVLDGLFVAVGAGWQEDEVRVQVNVPLFWLSADGSDWELVVVDGWAGGYIDALTTWQGQFLAAGYVGDERASAAFWSSADGRDWQRLPDQPVLEFLRGATEGRDIVAGGISEVRSDGAELIARGWLYCACESGVRDAIVEWRTTDGEEWQRDELPPDGDAPTPVQAGQGLLRIAPDRGTIERSVDGMTWDTAWAPTAGIGVGAAPQAQLFRLSAAPGGFLAVGASFGGASTQPLAVFSTDGSAWAVSTGESVDGVDGALIAFAADGGRTVAVGRVGDPAQPIVWVSVHTDQ